MKLYDISVPVGPGMLHYGRQPERMMVESMADGLILTDAHSEKVLINPAARRLLGFCDASPSPYHACATAAALLVGSWALYAAFGKGVEFFPDVEAEQGRAARVGRHVSRDDTLVGRDEGLLLTLGRQRLHL